VLCVLSMVAEFGNRISQTVEEIKWECLFKIERLIIRLLNEQFIGRASALVSAYSGQE
jgi:hypothetical protein